MKLGILGTGMIVKDLNRIINDFHFEYGKYLMLEYRVITAFTEAAQ